MTGNRILRYIGAVVIVLVYSNCYAGNCGDMAEYWVRFRRAIIQSETGEVASMTRFPFRLGGILDSHPVEMHERKGFPVILARLLSQSIPVIEGEGKIVEKTMLQHVQDKKALVEKDYNTPCMVTVELFEFQCADGKWQFTGAYFEE